MGPGLRQFLHRANGPNLTLVVVNRESPEPIQTMLEGAFENQPVAVAEAELPDYDDDTVLLLEETEDGQEVIASSPMAALNETVLLVNSDLYKTRSTGFDLPEFPAVLTGLENLSFRLRGYPESDSEKLLLIVISRHIERLAWQHDSGTLRASFQRLSRIDDERGTRAVYEKLADSAVQTHVYGIPDWNHPLEMDITTHGGYSDDFRESWFVVYTPSDAGEPNETGPEYCYAALLAIEVAPREWEGYWTFDRPLVEELDDYIATNL